MSVITSSRATERLSRRLQKAGISHWIGITSGDMWGKYLVFRVGGICVASAGWTLREASEYVDEAIDNHNADSMVYT